jgi:glycosyltransferase involved in cell wall biosynthesis
MSRLTSAVICVSAADLEQARRFHLAADERLRLIRNGVAIAGPGGETGRIQRADDLRLKLDLHPPIIGTVARLHRQKGVEYFVKAAAILHEKRPEATFVVVGGGPLEDRVKGEVARLGLTGRLILAGERTDALDWLSLFDIFVLPSLWEGLPLVLIEGAILGKPIAATDIDGNREVIRDGETGLLVPPADPAALAGAVLRLLNDPGLARRLGDAARLTIPPAYSLERMVAETERLYLDLAEANGL